MPREAQEGLRIQSPREERNYAFDTEPWGGNPALQNVKLIRVQDGLDVSETYLEGAYGVEGDNIISPRVKSLVAGELYRLRFLFKTGAEKREPFLEISCED